MNTEKKVLCLTEGASLEPKFFRYFALRLGLDVTIFQVRTNIYALYQRLKEEKFQLDVKIAVSGMSTAQSDKEILQDNYLSTYLIYDLDLQHEMPPFPWRIFKKRQRIQDNLSVVREMLNHFNDEYDDTVGKLLINYPMMESFKDTNAFFMREYQNRFQRITVGARYKRITATRVVHYKAISQYDKFDFKDLITLNAYKLSWLMTGQWCYPASDTHHHLFDQLAIFNAQEKELCDKSKMAVVNTSVLLPLFTYRNALEGFAFPRQPVPITLIVSVQRCCELRRVHAFMSSMGAQSHSNWQCIVVVPADFERILSLQEMIASDDRYKVVVADGSKCSRISLLSYGIPYATGDYIVFTSIDAPPVPFGLITLSGILRLSKKEDIVMFAREGILSGVVNRFKGWPSVGGYHLYDLTKGHAVRKACEALVREKLFSDVCYASAVLKAFDFGENHATVLPGIISRVEVAVNVRAKLFKKLPRHFWEN